MLLYGPWLYDGWFIYDYFNACFFYTFLSSNSDHLKVNLCWFLTATAASLSSNQSHEKKMSEVRQLGFRIGLKILILYGAVCYKYIRVVAVPHETSRIEESYRNLSSLASYEYNHTVYPFYDCMTVWFHF